MDILPALKETGRVVRESWTDPTDYDVVCMKGLTLVYEETKNPVGLIIILANDWVPYPHHPTPEKCGCTACELKEEMEKEIRVEERTLDKETRAVLWLLEQACKKEQP